ncbi:hypothetical protein LAZ67_21001863 [Cordylochernes scorpioides]|uniref:HTH CENPB-type domain-containing protein n=1 Tax=Cordylochernes scorpioides TaxID=51811 RepID=A0ABY6LMD1_9ARAC|nr:hypothetical protein LAZ67_21001863 [Cordylochernes scorpioides]
MSGARMSGSAKKNWKRSQYQQLTYVEKMKIIEEIEQGKSHSQVSRGRNIPRSTISTIFKNKFTIKSAFLKSNFSSTLKRDRDGEFPEIEEALFRWIRQANAMKLAINGNILKEKAILLALKMGQDNFEASNGWLEKFKARRNIAFKRLHGEAGSVDANSVATWKGFVMDEAMEEVVEEEMNRCFEALKKHQAIDVNYIDFLEVDKDVQVAGEQSIEEIVKEVMGKEEDEEISTEDEHGPGRPVESVTQENIDKINDLVMWDRRMTVCQIEETLGIPKTTVDRIMREHLGLRKLSARWVPKVLPPNQKATWVHHFTPESKHNPCNGDTPVPLPPKKAKTVPSAGKVMVSVFWDSEGVLLLDFLNKGQTITGDYYANLVKQLREAIKEKRRGKLSRKIVYHQDNAPSHRSLQAMATIYDSGFELLPHAPYSPDLAPSDFHLFPHLKKSLSGIHFRSDEEVIDAVTSFFESLETSFFLGGIKALEHRWKKGIDLKGDYVEG